MNTVTRYKIEDGELKLFHKREKIHEMELHCDPAEAKSLVEDWLEQATEEIPVIVEDLVNAITALDDAGDPDEEDKTWEGGSAVPKKYKDRYGKKQNCGDPIATAITEGVTTLLESTKAKNKPKKIVDPEKLIRIQNDNGIDGGKYLHLNPGMQVMNTSNIVRGMFWRGEKIKILGTVFDLAATIKKASKGKKTFTFGDTWEVLDELGFEKNTLHENAVAKIRAEMNLTD